MKKLYAVLLSLVMLAAVIVPALAAPESAQGPRGTFALVGNITAIGSNTVTVKVVSGNSLVKTYVGKELTLTMTAATRYLYKDGATTVVIGFADLEVGQPVSVNGTTANNVWTAKRVTVGASISCLP
ncbi:MAG: hypothetical protein HY869_00430 [Chloroflexi bacterium]|nr:hypothetical protein [Chloroflexota bacterium]